MGKLCFEKQFSDKIAIENVNISVITEPNEDDNGNTNEHMEFVNHMPHRHSYCEMFFCNKGNISIITTQKTYVLSASSVMIIPPEIDHYCIPDVDAEWAVINFSCSEIAGTGRRNLYPLFAPFMKGTQMMILEQVPELFDDLLPLHESINGYGYFSSLFSYVKFLIVVAETFQNRSNNVASSVSKEMSDDSLAQLYLLDSIINTDFTDALSLSVVAEQMMISERQLTRIIRKHYHSSFHQLLTEKRLTFAKKLLIETDFSVDDILTKTGFRSTATFYRCFVKQYHVPPLSMRKGKKKLCDG